MHDILLVGGSVLTSQGLRNAAVAVSAGRIVAIGENPGAATETIDCSNTWIGPGLVDVHVHFRDPGQEWKEDLASGSAAAAAGGFTAVVAMANTLPAVDQGDRARDVVERGREVGLLDVQSAGALTKDRAGEQLAEIEDLWAAGVRVFSDDGDSVDDPDLLRVAMEHVAALGGVVSQHAVDGPLSVPGAMHEGAVSAELGLVGIPRRADDITIDRDIELARQTGVRYHVQHISTARGVELVASAKQEGLDVTAEASPHHLLLTDEAVRSMDSRFKMMPPLRDSGDRSALVEGIRSGVIDAVATDHAPHSAKEKNVPFAQAANGVTGLEWAAAVTNQVVGLGQDAFFDRMSIAPARIGGFTDQGVPLAVGDAANIAVFAPSEAWTPKVSVSKSTNSPYLEMELTGRMKATLYRGRITYRCVS